MNIITKFSETILYYLTENWPDNIATKNNPDFKKYKDLNNITHKLFKETALKIGFQIEKFETVSATDIKLIRQIINRIPFLRNSILGDIFSIGAKSILIK